MNSYNQVKEMLDGWKQQNLAKPDVVVKLANACIGWPYVFGGRGEYCNPANRRSYYSKQGSAHPTIKTKCKNFDGNSGCTGCKWYPDGERVLFYDCRGFTYWVLLNAAGIKIEGGGASSQYKTDSNWSEKGTIDKMPKDKVCCVFRYDSSTGKYEHTLLYDGAGSYIHCSNGVEKTATSKYKATHYAIPKGLYDANTPTPEPVKPAEGTSIVNGSKVALRVGPTTDAAVILRVDTGNVVKLADEPTDWVYVEYNGKKGYMMKKFLTT